MATIYCDFEAGSDSNDGSTWALAKVTLQAACTAAAAGGIVYVRRTNAGTPTDDIVDATRTLSLPASSRYNPLRVIGCKDGTTAEPPATADLAVRGTDTLPSFENTGTSTNDLTVGSNYVGACFHGIRMVTEDRFSITSNIASIYMQDCELVVGGYFWMDLDSNVEMNNTTITGPTSSFKFLLRTCSFRMRGGSVNYTTSSPSSMNHSSIQKGKVHFEGVDLSDFAGTNLWDASVNDAFTEFVNCKLPATWALTGSPDSPTYSFTKVILSADGSSKGNADTYQDYLLRTGAGEVENSSVYRTGGADDGGTTGTFSYAMTPAVDSTLEGSLNRLSSEWFSVWVEGGTSKTLTVYTTHDNADSSNADLNEDDLYVEFLTPDEGDSALHDHTLVASSDTSVGVIDTAPFAPGSSTAAGVDDTTSTWSSHDTYKRSFSVVTTPGFSGFVRARVHFAKRYASSPVTVYFDPKIEVT